MMKSSVWRIFSGEEYALNQSNEKGQEIYDLAEKIFPYCRSITGQGVRDTLRDLTEYIGRNGGAVGGFG